MTTKAELLELACAQYGDTVVEKALSRYNRELAMLEGSIARVKMIIASSEMCATSPSMSVPMSNAALIEAAHNVAMYERMVWEALFDIAAGLQEAGVEVEW